MWLRSASAPTLIGRTGILLNMAISGNVGSPAKGLVGLYWHVVTPSSSTSYPASPSFVEGLFTPDVSNPHIRVEVSGDTYSAFVDGSSVPATTLTTSAFAGGQVALYSYSSQTFDNVVVATRGTGP